MVGANQTIGRPIEIMLVEDSDADVDLTREALKESQILVTLRVMKDGMEAYNYLFRRGQYAGADRPDIIVLDLNLPKKSGTELLAEIKASSELRRIPVIILTTSGNEADIKSTYDLHANCFISKPIDFDEFIAVVRNITDFWLNVVKLPPV